MKCASLARFALLLMVSAGMAAAVAFAAVQADEALSGKSLYGDVQRYAAFGVHRFGSEADRATTDWIAQQLEQAGFETGFQTFTVERQYVLSSAAIRAGDTTVPVLPFWWPPADKASMHLRASIATDLTTESAGRLVWLQLPFDGGAYLSDRQRKAVAAAATHAPVAILLTFANPGEEEYAYNVAQSDPSWPVPVFAVGSRYGDVLRAAQSAAQPIEIVVDGRYASRVTGRNVVGRLDRGAARTIVVSTPTTGWFTCGCERGSGVAVFLALARMAAASRAPVNYVFVATAGHEIGHGGMDAFMRRGAPQPAATRAWIHLGASLACYEWRKAGAAWIASKTLEPRRYLLYSPPAEAVASVSFAGIAAHRVRVDGQPPPGELRDVQSAGYTNFLGMAGTHRFFHGPGDTSATTGPDVLEPVARAFARALEAMSVVN